MGHLEEPAAAKFSRPQSTPSYTKQQTRDRAVLPPPTEGNLMVEGCQTGQLVAVEATRRLTVKPTPAENLSKPQKEQRTVDAERLERERRDRVKDRQTIRKLEAEVKRLKAAVLERDGTIAGLQDELQKANQKNNAVTQSLELEKRNLQDELNLVNRNLTAQRNMVATVEQELADARSQLNGRQRAQSDRENALTENIKQLESKLLSATAKITVLEKQETDRAQAERRRSLADTAAETQLQKLKDQLAEEQAVTQRLNAQVRDLGQQRIALDTQLKTNEKTIQQYNTFIQKICQPQFSVVKDESLTPVNPNGFNVVEGHVLVPLVLLLEGYSFLPQNMRDPSNQTHGYNPPTMGTRPAGKANT